LKGGALQVGQSLKKAIVEQRTIVFVDESGFRLLPALVRTYAPRGQTPILRVPLKWEHLSVMAALTPAGKLYTWVQARSVKGSDIVRFCATSCARSQVSC
jgi:hypothetical protein